MSGCVRCARVVCGCVGAGGWTRGGRGQATASACAADARESMHFDRSSPSPVLVWYMLIPAWDHVVLWAAAAAALNHRACTHTKTHSKNKRQTCSSKVPEPGRRMAWLQLRRQEGRRLKGHTTDIFRLVLFFFHPRLQKEQLHGHKIITSRNQHI